MFNRININAVLSRRPDAKSEIMGSCEYSYHAGDMPLLFGNHGYAFSIFLTDRFCVEELLGRTVIVNLHTDDFRSQPAGNSGMKIVCGVIERF